MVDTIPSTEVIKTKPICLCIIHGLFIFTKLRLTMNACSDSTLAPVLYRQYRFILASTILCLPQHGFKSREGNGIVNLLLLWIYV